MDLLGLMVNDPYIGVKGLHTIDSPTLVITGAKDMIKKSYAKENAGNISNTSLISIKGDYFIASKNSEEFNKRLMIFG